MTTHADALRQPTWCELESHDLASAVAFYGGVLGWQFAPAGRDGRIVARVAGADVAGLSRPAPGATAPAWRLYFSVPDVVESEARLSALGASDFQPAVEARGTGLLRTCRDATGAAVGLVRLDVSGALAPRGAPGTLVWSEVNTRDARAAAAFYATGFGLRDEPGTMMGTVYHTLHDASGAACGVLQMNEEWGDMPPHWMPYFAVADAEAAKSTIEGLGGSVPYGPFDTPRGRVLVAMDPHGAAVSFLEAPTP
jgi:predicted enzyme related to lactoylglutathione lyase